MTGEPIRGKVTGIHESYVVVLALEGFRKGEAFALPLRDDVQVDQFVRITFGRDTLPQWFMD